jgi:hypothetical protein
LGLGPGRRSERKRGARSTASLEEIGGAPDEDEKPSRQEQARGGGAHGLRPVADSGPAGDDAAQENAEDSQEYEASRAAVRSGRLRPDELHDGTHSNDRAARPEGRAKIAFGVTSYTPASETFAGRGTLASAPLLSTRRL